MTGHTISIGVKTLKTLLHIALTRISLWKMLLFKLQFYQLGWFWAFGVEETNMEDDELKVYLKWTLHVLIYCTQLHIERWLLLFSDMHIRQKCQWTFEQVKSSCCTCTVTYWNLMREVSRSDKEFKIAIIFRRRSIEDGLFRPSTIWTPGTGYRKERNGFVKVDVK